MAFAVLVVGETESRLPGVDGRGPDELGGLFRATEQRLKLPNLRR